MFETPIPTSAEWQAVNGVTRLRMLQQLNRGLVPDELMPPFNSAKLFRFFPKPAFFALTMAEGIYKFVENADVPRIIRKHIKGMLNGEIDIVVVCRDGFSFDGTQPVDPDTALRASRQVGKLTVDVNEIRRRWDEALRMVVPTPARWTEPEMESEIARLEENVKGKA